jgi:uncharacterized membrane protein
MFSLFVQLLITVLLLIFMDALWFTQSAPMYAQTVARVQGGPMQVRWIGGLAAWVLIAGGLMWFASSGALSTRMLNGAIFGFTAYGIFNATNYALFDKYDLKTATYDTLWGTFACMMASGLAFSY